MRRDENGDESISSLGVGVNIKNPIVFGRVFAITKNNENSKRSKSKEVLRRRIGSFGFSILFSVDTFSIYGAKRKLSSSNIEKQN